jgi:hypothetical protein
MVQPAVVLLVLHDAGMQSADAMLAAIVQRHANHRVARLPSQAYIGPQSEPYL